MLDAFILVALVHGVYLGYKTYNKLKAKQATVSAGAKAASINTAPAPGAEATRPQRLQVEGAVKPPAGNFGFLKLFGLGNAHVVDLCYIPGPIGLPDLAPKVADTLAKMYQDGDAVGSDVMEMLHHQKRLKENEFLWFALVSINRGKDLGLGHRVVAFVDKKRNLSPTPRPAA